MTMSYDLDRHRVYSAVMVENYAVNDDTRKARIARAGDELRHKLADLFRQHKTEIKEYGHGVTEMRLEGFWFTPAELDRFILYMEKKFGED